MTAMIFLLIIIFLNSVYFSFDLHKIQCNSVMSVISACFSYKFMSIFSDFAHLKLFASLFIESLFLSNFFVVYLLFRVCLDTGWCKTMGLLPLLVRKIIYRVV